METFLTSLIRTVIALGFPLTRILLFSLGWLLATLDQS